MIDTQENINVMQTINLPLIFPDGVIGLQITFDSDLADFLEHHMNRFFELFASMSLTKYSVLFFGRTKRD